MHNISIAWFLFAISIYIIVSMFLYYRGRIKDFEKSIEDILSTNDKLISMIALHESMTDDEKQLSQTMGIKEDHWKINKVKLKEKTDD